VAGNETGRERRAIWPGGIPKPIAPYSPAIKAGGWLFVAGQLASDFETGLAPECKAANPFTQDMLRSQSDFVLRNLSELHQAAETGFREVTADHQASFRLAVERGVRIAMGTDTGVGPHGSNAEELERMVEGGMTPMQAIVATTKSAAECARISHLTGTLEAGKRADLLGVDGDPLADIRVLQDNAKLALIMRDGRTFKSP